MENSSIKSMYGCIWFKDGSYEHLEGQVFIPGNLENVSGIGEHELGDEANVYIIFKDGSEKIIRSTSALIEFFKSL